MFYWKFGYSRLITLDLNVCVQYNFSEQAKNSSIFGKFYKTSFTVWRTLVFNSKNESLSILTDSIGVTSNAKDTRQVQIMISKPGTITYTRKPETLSGTLNLTWNLKPIV